ncbi:MAG: tyrosine-type recombinase/integrase [Ktedonobacterales bacterium]
MNQYRQSESLPSQSWRWPIDTTAYDLTPILSENERTALDRRFGSVHTKEERIASKLVLHRLLEPIDDVLAFLRADPNTRYDFIRVLLFEMRRRGTPFWVWSAEEWLATACPDPTSFALRYGRSGDAGNIDQARRFLPILSYLFNLPPDIDSWLQRFKSHTLAHKIFGRTAIDAAASQLTAVLQGWGYQQEPYDNFRTCVCYLLLRNRSDHLEGLTSELLKTIAQTCTRPSVQRNIFQISRALHALGFIERALPFDKGYEAATGTDGSVAGEWLVFCQRWRKQSTLQRRDGYYYPLLQVGRWLKVYHPEITSPAGWTYELSGEFIAAVNEMTIGQWSDAKRRSRMPVERVGLPFHPTTKNKMLEAMRTFLRDCQEWEWIPVRLNPHRALRTPSSIRKLLGPNPRVVDKDVWAKILWAAMNLEANDLPVLLGTTTAYPLQMIQALAVVWCFSALRANEIQRLRVGCIRWQYDDVMIPETGEILPKDATCFLDIPVNKTNTAYTKPVHPLVGQRIKAWEEIRPREQPLELDVKTSELVQFLFSYRGQRISLSYLNRLLIPLLCRKAGVPDEDSRGAITSHRARATIASMLYNAREPLDIFQLKEYLGHKHLFSTQHYVKIDPTKLASQVAKAGYLEQNLATIEVLLDQDAVRGGAAGRGEVWKYYDLGHGFCTNDFWADCKHRMACARCPFYRPKSETMEQLVDGKANLVRMLEFVALTEDEKLLVTEGIDLHQELIERLADVPTPAGPTPRELESQHQGEIQVIPIPTIRRRVRKRQREL